MSRDWFPNFKDDLFEIDGIYPSSTNDCYPINELCLTIGINQHINLDYWSNDDFLIFIDKLKSKTDCSFSYELELCNGYSMSWTARNGQIELWIMDDPQHILDSRTVHIDENLINKMTQIYEAVESYRTSQSNTIHSTT
jgi:hypothetical protein